MDVLVVKSGNRGLNSGIFISEQIESLKLSGIKIEIFAIQGHGVYGYLKNYPKLLKKIGSKKFALIHAHFGLSGLLSVMQRKIPVVITYHGSDVNNKKSRIFSKLALQFAKYTIFVNKQMSKTLGAKVNYSIIPCGIDMDIFKPKLKSQVRAELKIDPPKKIILFSSSFQNPVKNYHLAKKAIANLEMVELVELKGMGREMVSKMLSACDVLLLTSIREGSPQVIKEAMACNCPIVATNVGDVKEIINETNGCYIASFDSNDIAEKIRLAINFGKRTSGRENIKHLEINYIATKIIKIYNKVLNDKF